uniref:XK-related protein n=1 Tax=Ornithorhynchus anatinus TaxID=9258 RepID=F7BNU1_ORNAN
GGHWLGMTFWLVAQQSDIVAGTWSRRLFNPLAGALLVFCYVNLWASPSRNRLVTFYLVMLIENVVLLLLATDLLRGTSWRGGWVTAVVLSGFVIGCASLIIYYSLLHPKSTEIRQRFRGKSRDVSRKGPSFPSAGRSEESHATSPRNCSMSPWGTSVEKSRSLPSGEEGLGTHHHWLFVRLALKTGDVSKINAAFGEGGIGDVFLATRGVNQDRDPRLSDSEMGFSGPHRNGPVAQGSAGKASEAQDSPETKGGRLDASSYLTLPGSRDDNTATPDARPSDRERPVKERAGRSDDAESRGGRAGAEQGRESATFYYPAATEGSGSPRWGGKPSPGPTPAAPGPEEASRAGSGADPGTSPVSLAGVSPILGRASVGSWRRSTDLGEGGGRALPAPSADASQEGLFRVEGCHLGSVGARESSENGALDTGEEPCFTSTPKSQASKRGCDWRERPKREKSVLF